MKEKFEYGIILFLLKIIKILPEKLTFKLLNFIAILIFQLLKKRRELAIKNLSIAFNEKTQNQLYELAKQNYLSISKTIGEIALVLSKKRDLGYFLENEEEILASYEKITRAKKDNQGVIFITAHFGNWEILANYFARKGFPMTVIGRKGDNELIEKNITTPFRESHGNKNIHKTEAMNAMVKTLKNGGRIGILIDQKAGKKNSAITTFFGKECTTTISVASMKLKYDPLIIPAFCVRNQNNKIELLFLDPVEYKADELENKDEKLQAMTQRYNDIFEKIVKKYPEQWFWMHNRWKM